jgi:hypothetical protein
LKIFYLALVLLFFSANASCAPVKNDDDEFAFLTRAHKLVFSEEIDDEGLFESNLRIAHKKLDKKITLNQFANERIRIWSYFLRASLGERLLGIDYEKARTIDPRLASQTVNDFDVTASADEPIKKWIGTSVRDIMYSSALISLHFLKDEVKAFENFELCADLGHAGCANIVAGGARYGKYGQKIDIEKSVRYHKKVAVTGTDFRCAGSFSSASIAQLVFFEGVNTPEGDELFWIQQSIRLAKEVSATISAMTSCYIDVYENEQYLYQLARGVPANRPSDTRHRPEKHTEQVGSWAFGKLILDDMNQSEFDMIVAEEMKAKTRCGNWFNAAWLYSLRGDEVSRNKYRSRLLLEDEKECVTYRRYLKKIEAQPSKST